MVVPPVLRADQNMSLFSHLAGAVLGIALVGGGIALYERDERLERQLRFAVNGLCDRDSVASIWAAREQLAALGIAIHLVPDVGKQWADVRLHNDKTSIYTFARVPCVVRDGIACYEIRNI